MADSAGEKTEKATPKKREDERKEGNIFQSKEVVIAVSMIAVFFGFKLLYPLTLSTTENFMKQFFVGVSGQTGVTADDVKAFFISAVKCIAIACGPLLLIAMLSAVLSSIFQTKGLVNFKSLRPKFSRMSFLRGIKNLFSLRGLMELLKAVIKIVILFYVIYDFVKDNLSVFPMMMNMSVSEAAAAAGSMIFSLFTKVAIAFAFLAGFDYMYQRWDYEKKLRMTKQEVKEEYKNIEGDPQVKSKIKQRQQAMSRQRMMQAVPSADVVIRNPTHVAVALKYDKEKNHAPVVVAKGVDSVALRIVAIAEENNVMTVENVLLARALYKQVEIDREIPSEFYKAVAEVIALLYKQKGLGADGEKSLEA